MNIKPGMIFEFATKKEMSDWLNAKYMYLMKDHTIYGLRDNSQAGVWMKVLDKFYAVVFM